MKKPDAQGWRVLNHASGLTHDSAPFSAGGRKFRAGVSAEQVERAREIDLLSYLQSYNPQELKPDGPGRFTTRSHDSLVISNGKWRWNSQGIGGVSALDYLIKVEDMGFVAVSGSDKM